MSLANIQGKLSRAEMKNIMAGSGGSCCAHDAGWTYFECGLSMSQAQQTASYCAQTGCGSPGHWYWCCSSC